MIIGIARWWRKHALDGVTYGRRPFYRRAFPGERVSLRIEVENHKILPLSWLRVTDPWPKAVGPEDENETILGYPPAGDRLTHIFSLRWFQRANRKHTLVFRQRGTHRVGPTLMEAGDLFGIYETQRVSQNQDYLTVFPELITLGESPFPSDDPVGALNARRKLYVDPTQPVGVRDYRPGDDFRQIHWPATARLGQLQSKTYQPISARIAVLCLNVSTFAHHWQGTHPELLEYVISVAAGLAFHGSEAGYQIGLISNGRLANSDQPFRILPGRSPRQLSYVLEALAAVTAIIASPFDDFLIKEVPRLPYRAALMVVTALTSPALIETLLRLKKRGRQITLVALGQDRPPELPGIRVVHEPFQDMKSLDGAD